MPGIRTNILRYIAFLVVILRACVVWGVGQTCAQLTDVACAPTGATVVGRLASFVDVSGNLDNSCMVSCATGTLTGALTGNASTATALAANPTDCSANQFANAIAASGNLTCAQPAFADLSGTSTCAQTVTDACLAGRAGGQTLQGGTAASESLTLESTANATKGTIKLKDTTELWTAMPTTAGTGLSLLKTQTVSASAMAIDLSPVLTFNNANSGFLAVQSYPSLTYAASGSNPFILFAGSPSVDSSGDFNIPPYTIVSGGPQYVLTSLPGGAIANPVGVSAGFSFTPTLNISGAPGTTTITWSGIVGVDIFPQVIEDSVVLGAQRVTVPSYVGVNIRKPGVTGGTGETVTFTEGVGVDIADLTPTSPGTMPTQISLRSAGTSAEFRHAGSGIFGANAAPSARLQSTASAVGNEVFRAQTTATNDDPNYRIFQGRGTTAGAANLTFKTFATTTGSVYLLEQRCLGICTSGSGCTAGDVASQIVRATYKNVGGTLTEVTETADYTGSDASMGGTCDFIVSGTNILIRAVGVANDNVTWHTTYMIQNFAT